MGMMRAASDQDYDEEMFLNRSARADAQQPVRCTELGCNWTVWGESAKAALPKCTRHQPAEAKRAS